MQSGGPLFGGKKEEKAETNPAKEGPKETFKSGLLDKELASLQEHPGSWQY
jgi:hypothetical protein